VLRRLPVQHDGRTMPLDTLARETVWVVTGSYAWKGEDPVTTVTGWLFEPGAGAGAPVVNIGSSELAQAIGLAPSTTHASFVQLVQNPRALELMQSARQAEAEGRPRRGVLQDAEKLEQRLLKMQSVLGREIVRPVPPPGDPTARWSPPPVVAPESLILLMSGPRLPGWPPAEKIDQEIRYNELNPVRLSWLILLAALVVSIVAWVRRSKLLDAAAFGLLLAGFAMMSWGILLRWDAGDRIPAANMYESMLFLAWGVGLFAVVAYAVLRNRVVVLNAAVMAALTMALTDLLPIDRFIHPIAPVLAGTPWLAIHVPIIMVGYSVLALGLVVAHMQVGFTIFAPRRVEVIDRMYDLLYWYMFVGSILLIAGILTGSMWAASSWGRYWGWDPKEVWSLVAFLAYMAILHAKLDRLIGQFGVAAISIAAFQTIIMTYLGVNFVLTTGMHSYGMGDSPVVMWMVLVALAEAAFLAWGLVAYRKNRAILEGGAAA
jgi:cytochrome c-type biogenesis protein CcsB